MNATDVAPLAELARAEKPDLDTWEPRLPISKPLSWLRAADISMGVVNAIDAIVAERDALPDGLGYQSVVIVGHSSGAVFARAVWALAVGGQPDGTVDRSVARPWAARVDRLVLLGAVARGWSSASPVTLKMRILFWLANLIEPFTGADLLVVDLRRGSPFLTTTRLQTVAALAALEVEGGEPPITVQLLGTEDDLVAPADNVDLATGSGFHYIEVPGTGHMGIVEIDRPGRSAAREAFRVALTGNRAALAEVSVSGAEVADMVDEALDDHDLAQVAPGPFDGTETPARVHRGVHTLVFVLHGIRDYGFWTRKLAVRIKQRGRNAGIACRTVTSSYGYFPMGPFLLMSQRRRRAGWLMDQYVTARAAYPDATTFAFVGHSNGTYLLARALRDCPAMRFHRVVLAGSVLRPDMPWQRLMAPQTGDTGGQGQVGRVLNYVASGDVVLAWCTKALEPMRFADLGAAGVDGFPEQPNVVQRRVRGGHGAGLHESRWDEIADFVLNGMDPSEMLAPAPPQEDARGLLRAEAATARGMRWSWIATPVMAVAIAVLLFGTAGLLLAKLGFTLSLLAITLGIAGWLLWKVLTRL